MWCSCGFFTRLSLLAVADFDRLVQNSQADALEALQKIPMIEEFIRQAEDTTRQAVGNLQDAARDAELARSIGHDAQETAIAAYMVSDALVNHASISKALWCIVYGFTDFGLCIN